MRVHARKKWQEVIVTASGPQRRLELPNDIATINADWVMKVAPVTNVAPGKSSRVACRGWTSSIPRVCPEIRRGSDCEEWAASRATMRPLSSWMEFDSTFQKRGRRTSRPRARSEVIFAAAAALATIEIFKGPSAASLYGSNAANGVIVITTKRDAQVLRSGRPRRHRASRRFPDHTRFLCTAGVTSWKAVGQFSVRARTISASRTVSWRFRR